MKLIYKIIFGILIILFLAYLVLAQTTNVNKNLVTGRIVVSTEGASASFTSGNNYINSNVMIPTDFIALPKGKCDVVIASPIWSGMGGLSQAITVAEAKNTTVSRNIQTCTQNAFYGAILCDAKINLDDEYYLVRVDFANAVPYFTVNYQCKTF